MGAEHQIGKAGSGQVKAVQKAPTHPVISIDKAGARLRFATPASAPAIATSLPGDDNFFQFHAARLASILPVTVFFFFLNYGSPARRLDDGTYSA